MPSSRATPRPRCRNCIPHLSELRHRRTGTNTSTATRRSIPLGYKKQGGLRMQQVIDELYQLTEGQGHRQHRRGPAPDVGRAVLQERRQLQVAQLRRRRHHGLRLPRGHRRPARLPGRHRGLHQRRRRLPDDLVRTRHRRDPQAADQDHRAQQQLPRHGAPVAGAVLRQPRKRRGPRSAIPTS